MSLGANIISGFILSQVASFIKNEEPRVKTISEKHFELLRQPKVKELMENYGLNSFSVQLHSFSFPKKELTASVYIADTTIYLWEGLSPDEMVRLFEEKVPELHAIKEGNKKLRKALENSEVRELLRKNRIDEKRIVAIKITSGRSSFVSLCGIGINRDLSVNDMVEELKIRIPEAKAKKFEKEIAWDDIASVRLYAAMGDPEVWHLITNSLINPASIEISPLKVGVGSYSTSSKIYLDQYLSVDSMIERLKVEIPRHESLMRIPF